MKSGSTKDDGPRPPPEVVAYYEKFPEELRLESGPSRLEFERTEEILLRVLPKPPSRVVDVGGAGGTYSCWLAGRGYEVHLVDASPRLVEVARERSAESAKPLASLSVGDARRLPQGDGRADAVLLMGPLYHLPAAADRLLALREASRVLASSGVLVVAAISRYASALDGLARKLSVDPRFVRIRDRDLADGQHRNETDKADYFTTAYFHRPEDLLREMSRRRGAGLGAAGSRRPLGGRRSEKRPAGRGARARERAFDPRRERAPAGRGEEAVRGFP